MDIFFLILLEGQYSRCFTTTSTSNVGYTNVTNLIQVKHLEGQIEEDSSLVMLCENDGKRLGYCFLYEATEAE